MSHSHTTETTKRVKNIDAKASGVKNSDNLAPKGAKAQSKKSKVAPKGAKGASKPETKPATKVAETKHVESAACWSEILTNVATALAKVAIATETKTQVALSEITSTCPLYTDHEKTYASRLLVGFIQPKGLRAAKLATTKGSEKAEQFAETVSKALSLSWDKFATDGCQSRTIAEAMVSAKSVVRKSLKASK